MMMPPGQIKGRLTRIRPESGFQGIDQGSQPAASNLQLPGMSNYTPRSGEAGRRGGRRAAPSWALVHPSQPPFLLQQSFESLQPARPRKTRPTLAAFRPT
jgi:hypothetical protein